MSSNQETTLKQVCSDIDYGYTASADFSIRSPKFLRITDIQGGTIDWKKVPGCKIDNEDIKRCSLKIGDIVIARTGNSTGENAFIENECDAVFASFLIRFRPNPNLIVPAFLKYILRDKNWFSFVKSIAGAKSAQPGANATEMGRYAFSIPCHEEQKRVAKILGDLDRKIELNRRMNETLEQIGQVLFKHYFIDNPERKSRGIGTLSDITEITTGKGSVKSQESIDGKIPLYGANGLMGISNDFLYNEKLIITGRVGTLGKVKIVNEKAWFSDNVLIIRPNPKYFNYCYYFLKQVDFQSMNRGSTQPLITQTDLRNLKIEMPEQKILEKFEEMVNCLLGRVSMNDREIVTLSEQRDTLLPKLMSGEISV